MKPHHDPEGPGEAPRVSFSTLGCRLNQHDTAAMESDLARAGYPAVSGSEAPDIIIVNTCTVTARADQEARQRIRSLARRHPRAAVVVTGCYAQRAPEEVAKLPGVALVLGTAERERIAEALAEVVAPGARGVGAVAQAEVRVGAARAPRALAAAAPLSFGRTRALLKIQDGCNAFCSYCIVPYVRGRSRSLPLEDAVDQARRLLDAGFREIVLTGADLGAYGRDLGARGQLARLIEAILALGRRHRVRLSSIEPNKVDPEVLALLDHEPRLCRHLHLPLQSGSAATLRAMRRPYGPEAYAALVERAAGAGPVGIGADVIVGFPGEGEREFEESCRFLEALPFSYLHVFRYSARPGTSASGDRADAAEVVDTPTARARSERLRLLGEEKRAAFYRSLLGSTREALVERGGRPGAWTAMTDVYAPVQLRDHPGSDGLVPVRVERLLAGGLFGSAGG